jgi:hypothetical protein
MLWLGMHDPGQQIWIKSLRQKKCQQLVFNVSVGSTQTGRNKIPTIYEDPRPTGEYNSLIVLVSKLGIGVHKDLE